MSIEKIFSERRVGQIFGLIIGLSGLVCSAYLASVGDTVSSSVVGGSTVLGLVGIFVTGQYLQKKE